jgi:hypothetical protein
MLYALGFDKLIFGHSPSGLSILGSSLILGSAIVVALQKQTTGTEKVSADEEEARVGLMEEDRDGVGVQEVQLRTFR